MCLLIQSPRFPLLVLYVLLRTFRVNQRRGKKLIGPADKHVSKPVNWQYERLTGTVVHPGIDSD